MHAPLLDGRLKYAGFLRWQWTTAFQTRDYVRAKSSYFPAAANISISFARHFFSF